MAARSTKEKIIKGITIFAVLSIIGGLGFTSFKLYIEANQLKTEKESLQNELRAKKNELNDLKSSTSGDKAQIDQLNQQISQLQADNKDLEDKVAAFAKQAASCERIKKRLHIKG